MTIYIKHKKAAMKTVYIMTLLYFFSYFTCQIMSSVKSKSEKNSDSKLHKAIPNNASTLSSNLMHFLDIEGYDFFKTYLKNKVLL